MCLAYGQEGRRIVYQVPPVYPPVLRQNMIGGLVRVIAVVSPSGTVERTEPVGGNPVLVVAAQDAVKRWKFQPGPTQTRELVTLRFDPTHK